MRAKRVEGNIETWGHQFRDAIFSAQAEIIAYMDDYVLLICTTLPAILLLLVMRKPRQGAAVEVEPIE